MTKLISINERGTLTLPRDVRDSLGVTRGGQLILDVAPDGAVSLRAGAVFPVEVYSEERIREFGEMNEAPLKGRALRFKKPKPERP